MNGASLTPADIKALEQTRQKLFQLTKHLFSLQTAIQQNEPLPSWPTLQNTATIISTNLLTLSAHLQNHRTLFNSILVYPLPSFPGQSQENLLQHLLRKKLEPRVEDWVERGHTGGLACGVSTLEEGKSKLTANELIELWEWAGRAANEEAKRRAWGDDEEFTLEEREGGTANVATGLRRRLDIDENEEDGVEGDVEMDASIAERNRESEEKKAVVSDIPPLRLEEILRFTSTGALPGSTASIATSPTSVNPMKRSRGW
ncbi:MAG: mediator of RNA polymerase II transcription subunit 8 [Trichoglossum hirsutum]|nr:MAG: mediator of RNA polymerase II transcription subunit 8 [Trichoglossum hirsutum]